MSDRDDQASGPSVPPNRRPIPPKPGTLTRLTGHPHPHQGGHHATQGGSVGGPASSVDKATPAPPGKAPSPNVDKANTPSSQGRPPNVDKRNPATAQNGANVDNSQSTQRRPTPPVPNPEVIRKPPAPTGPAPARPSRSDSVARNLQSPFSNTTGNRPARPKDPSKPRGPSASVKQAIQDARKAMVDRNRGLDLEQDAEESLPSPSRRASRKVKTVAKKTMAHYSDRGRQMINRYKREQGIPHEVDDFDATDFVLWFLALKSTVSSSSWRVYRRAVYHTLMAHPDAGLDDALALIDNDVIEGDAPKDRSASGPKREQRRTSAQKEKRFPKADLDRYLAYLQIRSRSKVAPTAADWLVASIHTGLRPVEWRATEYQETIDQETGRRYVWLYVMNAKATNSRGNGLIRTLDLSNLPSDVLAAVRRISEQCLAWHADGVFHTRQSQVSQLIYLIGEDLYPRRKKHFCLYSCRHQFIANMKSIMSPEEVSALAGHRVTKTAVQNYGKKSSAWAPEDIGDAHAKPYEEDVKTVRQSLEIQFERARKLRLAGKDRGGLDMG